MINPCRINVYIAKEDIKKLKTNQVIQVVGKLENIDITEKNDTTFLGFTEQKKITIADMKQAYFLTDKVDLTGKVTNAGYAVVNNEMTVDNNTYTYYFNTYKDSNGKEIAKGNTITIKGANVEFDPTKNKYKVTNIQEITIK